MLTSPSVSQCHHPRACSYASPAQIAALWDEPMAEGKGQRCCMENHGLAPSHGRLRFYCSPPLGSRGSAPGALLLQKLAPCGRCGPHREEKLSSEGGSRREAYSEKKGPSLYVLGGCR